MPSRYCPSGTSHEAHGESNDGGESAGGDASDSRDTFFGSVPPPRVSVSPTHRNMAETASSPVPPAPAVLPGSPAAATDPLHKHTHKAYKHSNRGISKGSSVHTAQPAQLQAAQSQTHAQKRDRQLRFSSSPRRSPPRHISASASITSSASTWGQLQPIDSSSGSDSGDNNEG